MNTKTTKTLVGLFLLATMGFALSCIKHTIPIPPPPPPQDSIPGDVNLKSGLLLYLPFNGSIADSSGNNNPTVAINGASLTTDKNGNSNSAFGSNGSGQEVVVTNNGSIKFDTAWSISLGFMVNDTRSETYISMVDPATGLGPSFNFGNTLATLPYLACGTGDVSTNCSSSGVVDNYNITDSTRFAPVPGSWYNAVVIYHKGSVRIYINDSLISTKVGSGTQALLCPASRVVIGNWWDGNPPNNSMNMNGKLDNIRLYNRVLNADEIAQLSQGFH